MTHASIASWRNHPWLVAHPVWRAAFDWIERQGPDSPVGDTPLGYPDMLGRVMAYPLKPRDQCLYEAHRRTIDIQVTLAGCEGIEFADMRAISARNNYSDALDVEHFDLPTRGISTVRNIPGFFSMILPGEPHLPQINMSDEQNPCVRKLVVKVPALLVGVACNS